MVRYLKRDYPVKRILADGIISVAFVVLGLWEFFVAISIYDVGHDRMSPKDLAKTVNHLILPMYMVHFITCLFILLTGKWIQFLLQVPLLIYHLKLYLSKKAKIDSLTIRRTDTWKKVFFAHTIETGYYTVAFLISFVMFVFPSSLFL